MDKFRNWLSSISNKIVFGMLILIFSFLFLISLFSTCIMWYDHELTYYLMDASIFLIVGLAWIILFIAKKRRVLQSVISSKKHVLGIATLLWCVLLTGFIINTNIELVQDQANIYDAISGLIKGDYTMWKPGGYIYNYPFQNGMVLLYAPIMMVFGNATYWVAQIINLLFYWLLAVVSYKLAQKHFDDIVAVFTYIGILFFIPLWGYVKYFYGNLPGVSLALWAVYFILVFKDKGKWRYACGSAACMLLAVVYKENLLIYVIAIILVLIIESILIKKPSYLFTVVFILSVTLCGINGPAWIAHKVTGEVTNQGIPSVDWVAMGLRESYVAPGWYSGNASQRFEENDYSVEITAANALDSVHESMNLFGEHKMYALRFFVRKTASIWNNPEFEGFAVVRKGNLQGTLAYWMKDILYNGGIINTILLLIMNIMHSILLLGLLLYAVHFRKNRQLSEFIPLIAFIGAFLFHIVWEAKCQYSIIFFVGLIPYSFAGYRYTVFIISDWLQSKKQKYLQKGKLRGSIVKLLLVTIIGITFTYALGIQGDEMEFLWLHRHRIVWKSDSFTWDDLQKY